MKNYYSFLRLLAFVLLAHTSGLLCAQTTSSAPVRPVLECVRADGNGGFIASFGYLNENAGTVEIAVGDNNNLTPDTQNGLLPTTFLPGRQVAAFEIPFDGISLIWTLEGPDGSRRTTTASANSAACPRPVRPVLECVKLNNDGSTAVFGYLNENAGTVEIAVGDNNNLTPNTQNGLLPTTFLPGLQVSAFEIPFDGNNLVWTLEGPDGSRRTVTASANSSACPPVICDEFTVSFEASNAVTDEYAYSPSNHSVIFHNFYGNEQHAQLTFEEGARLTFKLDGSEALITGIAFFQSGAFAGTRWEVSAPYGPKNDITEPKEELRTSAYTRNGGPIDSDTWKLFLLGEGATVKELDAEGNYTGRTISLSQMPENGQYGLQIGEGANGKNIQLGASASFFWTFEGQTSTGNFNINLNPICYEKPDPDVTLALADGAASTICVTKSTELKLTVEPIPLDDFALVINCTVFVQEEMAPDQWVTVAGGEFGEDDLVDNMATLTLEGLSPGVHKYRAFVQCTIDGEPADCEGISETVEITVLNVDCGTFPWKGE